MKQRIGYIDAMRGFTMFLVVYGHVMYFGWDARSIIWSFCRAFRMPMFFFISGFIAYKGVEYFTTREWGRLLKRKAFIQLIPTAIIYSVYQITVGESPLRFFKVGLEGYWFTLVLFEFFVVYFTYSLLCNALRRGVKRSSECGAQHRRGGVLKFLKNPCVWFLAVGVLCNVYHWWSEIHGAPHFATVLSVYNFCDYCQFFALGLLCRQNEQKVYSLLRNDNIYTFIAVIFIGFFIFFHVYLGEDANKIVKVFLRDFVLRYSGLPFILGLFVRHSDFLGSDNRLCRAVRFVGRRTLDIYLLHYFFLPTMPYAKEWFLYDGKENVVLEVFVAGAIALGVLLIVLCVSFILRHSQILTKYLFGILPKK